MSCSVVVVVVVVVVSLVLFAPVDEDGGFAVLVGLVDIFAP
jgi:hypothetical protein